MITGAQAIVKALEKHDVTVCFGYPGVAITPFYDALSQSSIKHVLVRQEQNGGHAASGYSRITGKTGVCIATSGPGATNLITALATAHADSIPMVAITGQVDLKLLGHDVFQEADITGAAEPFVKYSYLVKKPQDIPRIMEEAFYIASTGRKGPVLIDVPHDVQEKLIEWEDIEQVNLRGYKPPTGGNLSQIAKVMETIRKAERPLIVAGGGVISSGARELVQQFCELTNTPVVCTMMGIGSMPKRHPLYFGMLGNNGKPYANQAVHESDVLVIAGARVADRAMSNTNSLVKTKKIIHIDIDTAEIGKNMGTTVPLVGDCRFIFRELLNRAEATRHDEWLARLQDIKTNCVDDRIFHEDYVNPITFVQKLSDAMEEDGVYVADVGQNQMWSADNYIMKKGAFMTTGGQGTMGYSIPCAMGVKLADPSRQVVAVCGDGSFQMSQMELATIRQNQVDVKIVIFKNNYLGLVREHQHKVYEDRYMAVSLDGSPDFGKLAEAYDMPFFRLESNDNMDQMIRDFLDCKGAALMECRVYEYDQVKGRR